MAAPPAAFNQAQFEQGLQRVTDGTTPVVAQVRPGYEQVLLRLDVMYDDSLCFFSSFTFCISSVLLSKLFAMFLHARPDFRYFLTGKHGHLHVSAMIVPHFKKFTSLPFQTIRINCLQISQAQEQNLKISLRPMSLIC